MTLITTSVSAGQTTMAHRRVGAEDAGAKGLPHQHERAALAWRSL